MPGPKGVDSSSRCGPRISGDGTRGLAKCGEKGGEWWQPRDATVRDRRFNQVQLGPFGEAPFGQTQGRQGRRAEGLGPKRLDRLTRCGTCSAAPVRPSLRTFAV